MGMFCVEGQTSTSQASQHEWSSPKHALRTLVPWPVGPFALQRRRAATEM